MQNKLQELTDKLYREGLSKGRSEGEKMLEDAKKEAARIVATAKETAEALVAEAKKTAAETKANAEGDIHLAARQTLATVRQQVENIITSKALGTPVTAALNDTEFLKTIIKTAIERFDTKAVNVELELLLPADKQDALKAFVEDQVKKQLSGGVDVVFDRGVKAGCKIGLKDGGYHISFTDKDFENLFAASLRAHIRNMLFAK